MTNLHILLLIVYVLAALAALIVLTIGIVFFALPAFREHKEDNLPRAIFEGALMLLGWPIYLWRRANSAAMNPGEFVHRGLWG